jgi:hypothetical protein
VDAVFYWSMTYAEIKAAIEGNQKRTKQDMQIQANMIHQLGSLIGVAVNEPKKYPRTTKEAFPKLFNDAKPPTKQQDWQVMKARIEQYNTYLKQKRGETG